MRLLLRIILQRHPLVPLMPQKRTRNPLLPPASLPPPPPEYPSPLGSAAQSPPLLLRWCGLLRPEQQQTLQSQNKVAAQEKRTASQVRVRAGRPREMRML